MPSDARRPVPTTAGEGDLLGWVDDHRGDTTNPHAVKLAQLADLVTGSTGMVPTRQPDGTYADETPPGAAGGAAVGSATPLPPSTGAGVAGGSSNSSHEDHQHPAQMWTPADYGLKGWTGDFQLFTGTTAPATGTIYIARIKLAATGTISNAYAYIATGGTTPTNCYMGIYDVSTLAQLAVSADQSSSWNTAGNKTVPMTTPTASLAAGSAVYVAFLVGGGTGLAVRSSGSAGAINAHNVIRIGNAGTGQAALPSTLATPNGSSTTPFLYAVS